MLISIKRIIIMAWDAQLKLDPNSPSFAAQCEELRRENAALIERNLELEQYACRDSLTPLYNRRHFMNVMDEEISRQKRRSTKAALLFVDVDGLKGVNDMHGHGGGDHLLVHIANLLMINLRQSDLLARLGGDEFGILLTKMTDEQIEQKIVRLSALIAQSECNYDGAAISASISIGYSFVIDGDTAATVMARADAAMYRHKRSSAKIHAA